MTGTASQNTLSTTNRFVVAGGVVRGNDTQIGFTSSGAGIISLTGGVLEITGGGTFTRSVGAAAGTVTWGASPSPSNEIGSGGFSAFGAPASVNIGGSPTPSLLIWNSSNFVADGFALKFGSTKSNATLNWLNPLELSPPASGYIVREINVTKGTGGDRTAMHGIIYGTSATADLLKTGDGLLELKAANTYVGNTLVQNGTLLVTNTSGSGTGSGSVLVGSGATFGGTGSAAGAVRVLSGGKLAPGNQSPLPRLGTLTINTSTSSLTLLPGSNFEVDVDNTGGTVTAADQLVVGSGSTSVDISNANLVFVFVAPGTGPVTTPTPRVLVKNDSSNPITGSFAGLPRGGLMDSFEQLAGSVKFTIYYSYDEATSSFVGGNDIAISFTHVPEPAALSLLALGALGLRRRRN